MLEGLTARPASSIEAHVWLVEHTKRLHLHGSLTDLLHAHPLLHAAHPTASLPWKTTSFLISSRVDRSPGQREAHSQGITSDVNDVYETTDCEAAGTRQNS